VRGGTFGSVASVNVRFGGRGGSIALRGRRVGGAALCRRHLSGYRLFGRGLVLADHAVGRLRRRLLADDLCLLVRLPVPNEAVSLRPRAETVGLRLNDRRRDALHANPERSAQVNDLLVRHAELSCELVNAVSLGQALLPVLLGRLILGDPLFLAHDAAINGVPLHLAGLGVLHPLALRVLLHLVL